MNIKGIIFKKDNLISPFIKKHFLWLLLNIFVSLIVAGLDVFSGHYIKIITDSSLKGSLINPYKIALILIIIITIGFISRFLVGISGGVFSFKLIQDIRNKISSHLSSLTVSYLESRHSGHIVTKLTSDVNILQGFFQTTFPLFLYNAIIFFMTFVYLLFLNWKLTLISVFFIPLSLIIINYLSKPLKKYLKNEQESLDVMAAVAQDSIGGIYIEKSYNLQKIIQDKFNSAVDNVLFNALKRQKRRSYIVPVQSVVKWMPLLACAIYGGFLAFSKQLSTGSLFAFIYLLQYLVDPLTYIENFIVEIRDAKVSVERINDLLSREKEKNGSGKHKILHNSMIEFKNVCFNYNESTGILCNINFRIEQGKKVALVGPSGSGKSTIFKLICRFYSPQSGKVIFFGNDLSLWDIDKARRQLSLVSQETFLFPGTIAENISFGKPDAVYEEIINASKMANAHEFIVNLPEGYNTFSGERGIKFSGGQKQRINLARAFLKNAPILLLDEPTSALDAKSELMIQDALDKFMRNRTVLVIAHRLSAIKDADEIILLDHGKIINTGTHKKLLAEEKLYSQLYLKQMMTGNAEGKL